MRSPALISAFSKAGCHAVLASLSGRYPPLEGRSPTCYSPVRHSTQGRSPFRVRLACVRHAASVDSEPGSNSHVNSLFHTDLAIDASQLLTRAPVDLALALFRLSLLCDGAPHRCDTHHADTRRVFQRNVVKTFARYLCACTHYLVFKEPDRRNLPVSAFHPSISAESAVFRGTF